MLPEKSDGSDELDLSAEAAAFSLGCRRVDPDIVSVPVKELLESMAAPAESLVCPLPEAWRPRPKDDVAVLRERVRRLRRLPL